MIKTGRLENTIAAKRLCKIPHSDTVQPIYIGDGAVDGEYIKSEKEKKLETLRKKYGTVDGNQITWVIVRSRTIKKEWSTGKMAAASGKTGNVIDNKKIEDIADDINEFLESIQADLQVEIHREENTAIFKIVRKDDGKVIGGVPPGELLEVYNNVRKIVSSLFDSNA